MLSEPFNDDANIQIKSGQTVVKDMSFDESTFRLFRCRQELTSDTGCQHLLHPLEKKELEYYGNGIAALAALCVRSWDLKSEEYISAPYRLPERH